MLYFASTCSNLDALQAHPNIGVMTGPRAGGLGSIRTGRPWASDCDILSKHGYDEDAFYRHLERLTPYRATCHFVVVPDVVGCAQSTLALYDHAAPVVALAGLPLAYVAQDGAEHEDFPPCDVVFLGGSDPWRAQHGTALLSRATAEGFRTHVGRVNSARRVHQLLSYADSCDGTYVGFNGVQRGLRDIGKWLSAAEAQTPLLRTA